jgi:hypothetical protein
MSDPTISEKVERCQRLMAADGTLAAPRATECPTMEAFLTAHFDANPEATPERTAAAWAEVMRNPLLRGMCDSLGSLKDILKQLGPLWEQIQALIAQFQKVCPQPAPGDGRPGCGGGLFLNFLKSLCPALPCACGDNCGCGQDCCPTPNPPDDGKGDKNG